MHESVQFQKKIQKIKDIPCSKRSPNTENLVISRCCFAFDGKEIYKDLERTCRATHFYSSSYRFNFSRSLIKKV